MRTAGLSLLTALTALHAATVNGLVTCNTESPLPATSATSLSRLQDRLVSALCHTPLGEFGTASENLEGLTFEFRRSGAAQDVEECKDTLSAIISQCIRTGKASGGESHVEAGVTYLVYSSSSDDRHSNHARAPGPPKPAPANSAPVKPAPVQPAPVKSASVKLPPTPVKASPAPVPAKTIKIGPTKDCKQLALLMQTPTKTGKLTRNIEEDRGGFVGSRVDVNNKEDLARRAPDDGDDDWDGPNADDTRINHEGRAKGGSACGIKFDALNYPKAESMPAAAPFFSIDSPDNFCETIRYQETKTAVLGLNKYHIAAWELSVWCFLGFDTPQEPKLKSFANGRLRLRR